uniref:Uncharacterized protein n=1 Tax=Arundo donax TaxID=35708 RepID=A0A0A9FIL6_ARUDO
MCDLFPNRNGFSETKQNPDILCYTRIAHFSNDGKGYEKAS